MDPEKILDRLGQGQYSERQIRKALKTASFSSDREIATGDIVHLIHVKLPDGREAQQRLKVSGMVAKELVKSHLRPKERLREDMERFLRSQ